MPGFERNKDRTERIHSKRRATELEPLGRRRRLEGRRRTHPTRGHE